MAIQRIGVIGAMDEEIERIEGAMSDERIVRKANIDYRQGLFCGKPIVLCKSGVGKVNAAVCTQILIDSFGVDAVVFTGVAGALDPELDIGDIVVSAECQQHDMDVTALGFPKGTIPFAEQSVFPADPELVELAYRIASESFEGKTVKGRVLSGDQFIADREQVMRLRDELAGACTEMEGAAVAQVCAMNGVPYVVIRSMSDKADGSAHINFAEFTKLAADHSYRIVEQMIKKL